MKSGGHDRFLLGRRGPAERGPQPGQQLVHAERLGDVVVGAGIERRDLVGLRLAHRQHDDRHLGPAPQALDHLDAVDAREARGRGPRRRDGARRELEPLLTGLREVDVVAPGPQVDAERPPDLRLVVDDEDAAHGITAGRLSTIVAPPPGVSSTDELAAHRLDEAARDREPEADARAVARVVAQPLERQEDQLPLVHRDARSVVDDPQVHAVGHRARLDPDALIGRRPRARVVDDVGDRTFEQRGHRH